MLSEPATRAQAEALLHAFAPRMGQNYATRRNYDFGPGAHRNVSGLSPFVRRRLVTERDLVATALAAHGPHAAEKFVQEVIWRGYFKGWLERRPGIWASYCAGRDNDLALMDTDRRLRRDVAAAISGTTGLACFDAWAQELTTTGYLHNHARMWFASIWIFTLGLPWRLGADFFLRHLLDGDPASNTLGWRWVAGLHTRGKAYAAQAHNIAQFTDGRFTPRDTDLAADVEGLERTEPDGLPSVTPLRTPIPPQPGVPSLLLITEEDCRPEDFDLTTIDIRAVATLAASTLRSPLPVPGRVAGFEGAALADAATRTGHAAMPLHAGLPRDLASFAARAGARQIVTPFIPQGPLHDWLQQAAPDLDAQGIRLCEWQRDWDRAIWPHATAGFFKVKKQIPAILRAVGLEDAGTGAIPPGASDLPPKRP
ncbi:FAD-binding domain-containing protein [Roseicitreum antarcticum]|uniref:Deoxyribodipyrimidine photo-lyase n=1 Tax=Roseicitreum antarcticum TaxID=564137 RepID=A0A1H2VZ02_9RHOB|nr:FAD-binding domain-containing protein [Roseicitreum antarcticum]SDW73543.1 deoxyribodipyrimidine photo-lyase [Roseicitreum antarcticum]